MKNARLYGVSSGVLRGRLGELDFVQNTEEVRLLIDLGNGYYVPLSTTRNHEGISIEVGAAGNLRPSKIIFHCILHEKDLEGVHPHMRICKSREHPYSMKTSTRVMYMDRNNAIETGIKAMFGRSGLFGEIRRLSSKHRVGGYRHVAVIEAFNDHSSIVCPYDDETQTIIHRIYNVSWLHLSKASHRTGNIGRQGAQVLASSLRVAFSDKK